MKAIVLDFEATDASEDGLIVCKTCHKIKVVFEFYISTIRKGATGKCKSCHKEMAAIYRANNKDKIKLLSAQPHSVEARKTYQSGVGREAVNAASKRHRDANPKRAKAKSMISHAIRDGNITRPSVCEACKGTDALQGHHCDYNKPMDVMWLCVKCHTQWHKENTPLY